MNIGGEVRSVVVLILALAFAIVIWLLYLFLYGGSTYAGLQMSDVARRAAIPEKVLEAERKAAKIDVIDITGCSPVPEIAEMMLSSDLTIVNGDKLSHALIFRDGKSISVPPQSSKPIKMSLWHLPGLYEYQCDNTPRAGALLIKS